MKSTIPIVRAGLLLALVALPLCAIDGATVWEKTFHREQQGVGSQYPIAARELADGTTLTVVFDGGVTALNYDHSGQLLRSSSFYPVYGATVAAVDPFGGVFVAAEASAGYGYEKDIWLMKYDGLSGKGLWPAAVTIGAGNHQDDEVFDLLVDPAGDVILEAADIYLNVATLRKYDGVTGELKWGPVATAMYQSATPLATLDGDGNVYLTGRALEFFLTKYAAATGAVVWQQAEPDEALRPVAIGLDGSGNVVVAGGVPAASIEANKYSGATGERIWGPARYTVSQGTVGLDAAAIGSDGSVVLFGHELADAQRSERMLKFRGADGGVAWSVGAITDSTENFQDARLSLAGNGDPILDVPFQTGQSSADLKTRRFDGSTGGVVWGPQTLVNATVGRSFVGSNGRVFVAALAFNATDADVQLLERSGDTGAPAWGPITFDGAAAGYTQLWDLAAAPDGNVVVTGDVEGSDGTGAWATLKYDRSTGAVLWGPVYHPSGNFSYSPWQVLMDAAGDVLVAGFDNDGMRIVKYAGATGAELWVSTAVDGFLLAFALDPSGNGLISGYNFNGAGYDIVTAKISDATGTVLWGPVIYDSGFDDFADRIASDAAGNVIVAGHSNVLQGPLGVLVKYAASDGAVMLNAPTPDASVAWLAVDAAGDIFEESYATLTTTKYSGATGGVLWGPLTVGSGYGSALALNASGDVFVAGSLYSPATGYDYAVIKYHGSDGAVLWGPVTYSGSSGWDYPVYVVVDGSGNAVVTGTSDAGSNEKRTATLSYDGATGGLRWGPVGQNIARESVNGLAASGSRIFVGATRGDVGYLVTALDETLGIATIQDGVPAAACGHALDLLIVASNGTPPYSWSISSGALPPNVTLGSNGHLAGAPSQEGTFSFRVQVQDAALANASRDFTMVVGPGADLVPIAASTDEACQVTLSVAGSYAAYSWLPGGETTPTITVDPTETTTYGVVLDDGSACRLRGAVTITPNDPDCIAPIVYGISPNFGPAGAGVVVSGNRFLDGAGLFIGGMPATNVVFESALAIEGHTPALAPGSVNDVLVINPDERYGMVLRRFAADFLDVAQGNPFYSDIMKVDLAGITAGCGGGNYCPNGSVSRAQMAVFLLKAEHGFFYVPPGCTGVFADVACPGAFAVDWIEQLAAEGVTGGCGGGNYCPDGIVNRAQMSAFLLKAEHGSSYVPPPCVGVFGDVPCGAPFADWIEQLFTEGITGGCGNGNYCPSSPNTRGQMAVFLSKTFNLQ